MLDGLGYFLLGAGCVVLGSFLWFSWDKFRANRRKKKFQAFVDRLRKSIDVKDQAHRERIENGEREISELTFRDKSGVMNTVKIVVDPNLEDALPKSQKEFDKMLSSGNTGTLSDLIAGHKIEHEPMKKVEEFVFSPNSVKAMRSAGLELDEVVTKMLRASGRID